MVGEAGVATTTSFDIAYPAELRELYVFVEARFEQPEYSRLRVVHTLRGNLCPVTIYQVDGMIDVPATTCTEVQDLSVYDLDGTCMRAGQGPFRLRGECSRLIAPERPV